MEFRTLQYFLTVASEENLSRAADLLHVTQPTLSRQMAQLEEELGTQLFIRGRHLSLTEDGVMFRRRALEVVRLMDKLEQEFESREELSGVISIGCGGLNASCNLSQIMLDFHEIYPKIQYEIYANHADYVREQLDRGLLDFGLLMEPVDVVKYDYIRLKSREHWGIFMSADCPLAARECITRDDLKGLWLYTPGRLSICKELSAWLGEDLSELNIFGSGNLMISNTVQLLRGGAVYALTVDGAVSIFAGEQFTFRPLYPELSMSCVLAWKKQQPTSAAARAFLEYFRSCLDEDGKGWVRPEP